MTDTLHQAATKALEALERDDNEDLASCEARHVLRAALAGAAMVEQEEQRCTYCDGTGDLPSIDGEWRGICHCVAAPAPQPAQEPANRRKIFVCTHCDCIYADQPVSQCDCMGGTGADFIEGFAEYSALLQSAQPSHPFKGIDTTGMIKALERVIEAHAQDTPFHQPINADAMTALRILKGVI